MKRPIKRIHAIKRQYAASFSFYSPQNERRKNATSAISMIHFIGCPQKNASHAKFAFSISKTWISGHLRQLIAHQRPKFHFSWRGFLSSLRKCILVVKTLWSLWQLYKSNAELAHINTEIMKSRKGCVNTNSGFTLYSSPHCICMFMFRLKYFLQILKMSPYLCILQNNHLVHR